jgi:OOP family OmpA-OmpF porin
MKKSILLSILFLVNLSSFGQIDKKITEKKVQTDGKFTYNKWIVELSTGQSKGINPYTSGYFSSNPDKNLGSLVFNNYNLGIRYMMSPKFGLKVGLSSDKFENHSNSTSKKFETQQYRIDFQGVVNASRLFDIQDQMGRFNIFLHGGFQLSQLTPKADTGIDPIGGSSNYNVTENNFGVIFGLSPTFRITNKIALTFDFSMLSNFRQHLAWDGHSSSADNNLSGRMINGSFGINYSFGKEALHGDYAIVEDKKLQDKLDAIDAHIGEIETLMNDTDKDGVPDYLDAENNSMTGVAVDTKGRMIDLNNNGIPDELERYLEKNYTDKATQTIITSNINENLIKKLINDGFVTTYFETNKSKPTNVSTEGIDFILTYLRNNPTTSIDIIGNADEIGSNAYNNKLALDRATNVKNTLVKAGIDATRLNVVSNGEDKSVDPKSKEAKNLVRRVTFRVK